MRRFLIIAAIVCMICGPTLAGPGGSNYDSSAQRARGKQIADARSQINRVLRELRRDFEQSSELLDARASFHRAAADYQAACDAALTPLRESLRYKQHTERAFDLETRLKAARSDNRTTGKQLTAMAMELFQARQERSKMEAAVIASDPAVTTARFAMIDANGKITAMRREFTASILYNAQYRDARARLDAVRGVSR